MNRFEIPKDTRQILEAMREAGYLFVHQDELKERKLKDQILKKKWITFKEIADSNIWNVSSKGGVERIVKNEVDPDCIDKHKTPHKIHRSEVERIAKDRNQL